MSYCDLEGPSLYSTKEYVARKRYVCCECSVWIQPGERYVSIAGKWEGEFSTYKQHILCAEACEVVRDGDLAGGCLPFGGLHDFWSEQKLEMNKKDVDVAAARAKYAMVRRRERAGAAV